jgi:hypothetical protein
MGPFCVSDPFVPLPFFSDYSFRVHQSLTRMTGNYLHMQWPLTLLAQLLHWCMERSNVWVSTKPLITEEFWPGRGLNPGLPNDTPALCPLFHKLNHGWGLSICKTFKDSHQTESFILNGNEGKSGTDVFETNSQRNTPLCVGTLHRNHTPRSRIVL